MATFNGTAFNDTIVGGWGNDLINGSDGDDLLDGFYGFDTLNGGNGVDTATYAFYISENGAGILADLKQGIVRFPGDSTQTETLIDIENLIGSMGNDALHGNDLNNSLVGGYGNDWLNGRDGNDNLQGGAGNDGLYGGTGNDTMTGGQGDDTYFVDSAGDAVIEAVGGGKDTVLTSLESYTLGDNVENLNLGFVGIIGAGNSLNNEISGNELDNALYGKEGDDILYGNAGNDGLVGNSGNDTMVGGIGNDSYWVEESGDVVVEAAGSGTDKVFATVNYTLGDHVENLYLMPHSNASKGIGNDLNNAIGLANTGNDRLGEGGGDQNLILSGMGGDDTLSGGSGKDLLTGGAGRDWLTGGDGDDRYVYTQLKDAGGYHHRFYQWERRVGFTRPVGEFRCDRCRPNCRRISASDIRWRQYASGNRPRWHERKSWIHNARHSQWYRTGAIGDSEKSPSADATCDRPYTPTIEFDQFTQFKFVSCGDD